MNLEAIAFYIFATVLVIGSLMVITARNPVHSVLFLVLCFFTSAGLFVMLGAEFIAMLMVIVYVGAVAVLFLFVVMMLDIDFSSLRKGAMQYVPVGFAIGIVLLAELYLLYRVWGFAPDVAQNLASPEPPPAEIANTEALGMILYTDYVLPFQIAGLVLFVAMIGAIVLTHRVRPGVRKQKVAEQFAVQREDAVEIVKVTPGTGA